MIIQQSTKSNRRVRRGCGDSTIEPDIIATFTNAMANKTQQSTNVNENKEVGNTSGDYLTDLFFI